jgi:hypothetical protein
VRDVDFCCTKCAVTRVTAICSRKGETKRGVRDMNGAERGNLLRVLRAELAFLEGGGYRHPARAQWRPQYVFQDSPTCINFGDLARSRDCEECPLMHFVPHEHRNKNVPCHHIPLSEKGETVDSLYRAASPEEVEEAVAEWLRATIARLEPENVEVPVCALAQNA